MGLMDQVNSKGGTPSTAALKTAFLTDDGDYLDGLPRICIYGDSGGGKTVGAAQLALALMPPEGKALWLDTAVGYQSLRNHPEIWNQRHRLVRKAYKGLSMLDMISRGYEEGDEDFTQYKCIVLDEHSSMHKINLDRILQAAGLSNKMEDINSQPHYLTAQNQMWRETYAMVTKIPVPIIFVSHMTDKADKNGKVVIRPDYQPGFLSSFKELLTVIGYFYADETDELEYHRTIQCNPTRGLVAKTRIQGMPLRAEVPLFIEKVKKWVELGGAPESDTSTNAETETYNG